MEMHFLHALFMTYLMYTIKTDLEKRSITTLVKAALNVIIINPSQCKNVTILNPSQLKEADIY